MPRGVQLAHTSLKAGLEALGGQFLNQNPGVMEALWPWVEQLVEAGEGVDPAMEVRPQGVQEGG